MSRLTHAIALRTVLVLGCLVGLPTHSQLAHAAWPNAPTANLPVCVAGSNQTGAVSCSDGAGGAIVAWTDSRFGFNADEVYVQRVTAAGIAAWAPNGVSLTAGQTFNQNVPAICADGAGGAIVAWIDSRTFSSTQNDIYVQRVNSAGVPQWTASGVALCTNAEEQEYPCIVSDGAGGAIVAWTDHRAGNFDIYARRIDGAGVPQGVAGGVVVCTANQDQQPPQAAPDGTGGAFLTWVDPRSSVEGDIFSHHLLHSGAVDGAWPVNGLAVCVGGDVQQFPRIIPDGASGAIIAWQDRRTAVQFDIYAQHVLSSGSVDPNWIAGGRALCTATGDQSSPVLAGDAVGGAIVAWSDARAGGFDIYAQHILPSGVVDGAWPLNGLGVVVSAASQRTPAICADAAGGALIVWEEASVDGYAQHVLASGALDPAWPANGRAVRTAAAGLAGTAIVADGSGGAVATWSDFRNSDYDIYAQRFERFGRLGNPEPVIASVRDVPGDQGGRVKLSWNASYLDTYPGYEIASYDVWRSAPPAQALLAVAAGARLLSEGESPASTRGLQFMAQASSGQTLYWEFVANHQADGLAGYSSVVPTTSDSAGTANPRTLFMVEARHNGGYARWSSPADSGYSVDNLAPVAPAPFTAAYIAGATHLHWGPQGAADFATFRLYRGASAAFVPALDNLVATTPDTGYVDTGAAGSYYKLSAIDVHGNESAHALVSPAQTLDSPRASAALEFALEDVRPNPVRARDLVVRFTLPSAERAWLELIDVSGRRVRVRDVGGSGRQSVDLGRGGRLAPGVYLVRLSQGRSSRMRRAVVID